MNNNDLEHVIEQLLSENSGNFDATAQKITDAINSVKDKKETEKENRNHARIDWRDAIDKIWSSHSLDKEEAVTCFLRALDSKIRKPGAWHKGTMDAIEYILGEVFDALVLIFNEPEGWEDKLDDIAKKLGTYIGELMNQYIKKNFGNEDIMAFLKYLI